jgi:hypothetical protein
MPAVCPVFGTRHRLPPLTLNPGVPHVTDDADDDPEREQVPLPADDEAPLEEDMSEVDAADSVASEHPDN